MGVKAETPYSVSDICRAARAIQPHLDQLLELPHAQNISQQIDHMLANRETPDMGAQLLKLLQTEELTRQWVHYFLDEQMDADSILALIRTYHPLTKGDGAIASPRYCCPVASCHREWYRRSLEETIPTCPIHNLTLVRASKT
jgi:hypothetical protein